MSLTVLEIADWSLRSMWPSSHTTMSGPDKIDGIYRKMLHLMIAVYYKHDAPKQFLILLYNQVCYHHGDQKRKSDLLTAPPCKSSLHHK